MKNIRFLLQTFPIFVVFSLIFFNFDSGLIISLLLVLSGLVYILHERMGLFRSTENILFTSFVGLAALLIPLSLIPIRSAVNISWWIVYLGVFLVMQIFASEEKIIERLSKITLILTSVLAVISVTKFIEVGLSSYTRLTGIFGNHNVYGGFLLLPFLLGVYLVGVERVVWKKYLWMLLTSFILSNIVLTFSRGTWLCLVIGLFVILFIAKFKTISIDFKKFAKNYGIMILASVMIVGGIWSWARYSSIKHQGTTPSDVGIYSNENAESNAFTARLHYFSDAIKVFITKPVVGYGPGMYVYALRMNKTDPSFGSFSDPHNWALKMLVENGVLAASLFFVAIIFIFLLYIKNIFKRNSNFGIQEIVFVGLLIGTMHALIDFDWSFNASLLLFFIFAGALYGNIIGRVNSEKVVQKRFSHWVTIMFMIVFLSATFVSFQVLRADSYRKDGDYFFQQKSDYLAARAYYLKSAEINRYEPSSWFSLWQLGSFVGDNDGALNYIKRAISIFPENGMYHSALAQTLEESKNRDGYMEALQNSIKYFPANSLTNYVKLADYYAMQKKHDEALELINRVLPIYTKYEKNIWFNSDPNSLTIKLNIALLNDLKQRVEKEKGLVRPSAK